MKTEELARALEEHPFTHSLTDHQRKKLLGLCQLKRLGAGAYLLREGHTAETCYLLIDGFVAVELHVPGRGVVRLETLGPGDLAGWSWFLPPHRGQFDVRSLEDVRFLALDGPGLRALFEQDPALGYPMTARLLSVVAERLQAARLQLLDMYSLGGESHASPDLSAAGAGRRRQRPVSAAPVRSR